jgi:DnaK suppressor protein
MTCHVARRLGEFERRLRRERRDAQRAFTSTDAELAGLERHQAGEFSDDAAREMTCRLLSSLEERDRRVLAEIDAAEDRLSTGTFGVCEGCGQRIPFSRLRALPVARLCRPCEETAELVV